VPWDKIGIRFCFLTIADILPLFIRVNLLNLYKHYYLYIVYNISINTKSIQKK